MVVTGLLVGRITLPLLPGLGVNVILFMLGSASCVVLTPAHLVVSTLPWLHGLWHLKLRMYVTGHLAGWLPHPLLLGFGVNEIPFTLGSVSYGGSTPGHLVGQVPLRRHDS